MNKRIDSIVQNVTSTIDGWEFGIKFHTSPEAAHILMNKIKNNMPDDWDKYDEGFGDSIGAFAPEACITLGYVMLNNGESFHGVYLSGFVTVEGDDRLDGAAEIYEMPLQNRIDVANIMKKILF